MKTLALAALSLALALPALADDVSGAATAAPREERRAESKRVPEVSVKQLEQMIADEKVAVFDANGAETRTKFGTIPGATLLASSSGYELSVLPEDKSTMLVFYCANTRCTASDTAALRARHAGYENVAVLRVGIKGWVDDGKQVTAAATNG